MSTYFFKRLLSIVPSLLFLSVFTFFILRLAPGGPFDSDRAYPPEIMEAVLRRYHLDESLLLQFWHWLRDVVQGDLHESFQYTGKPVTELIAESLPASAALGLISFLFAAIGGVFLGAIAAAKKNTWLDWGSMFIAVSSVSLPSYLVASILVLIFSSYLGVLPPALYEDASSLILPSITLGLRPLALVARLTRSSLVETLQSDYIRTAYAKGLTSQKVVFKHALRNSLVPILALLGPVLANLITGSFVVEMVFQLPGLGKYFVGAVLNRDYPLVMGVMLVYGTLLMLSNLLVDLLTAWADPRIRLEG